MELPGVLPPDVLLCHDFDESFEPLLRAALSGRRVGAALGPIYREDPAAPVLAPFVRSARESRWHALPPESLAPDWAWDRARVLRVRAAQEAADISEMDLALLDDWTRAGLVLGVARRCGVRVYGTGTLHFRWRLNATVTGRFGAESQRAFGQEYNPLRLAEDRRHSVVPSSPDREVAVIDFQAMDLCSMASLVPDLWRRYAGASDMHARTAELLFGASDDDLRDTAKREVFIHAYGGQSVLRDDFERFIPELSWLRDMKEPGAGARLIQARSSQAFRAGLARALPLLLGPEVMPMFTVHDEVVLDVAGGHRGRAEEVSKALAGGASQRNVGAYMTRMTWGKTYAEAKGR